MTKFLVNGWPVDAVSQEWAMMFYKLSHDDEAVKTCTWLGSY